MSCEKGNLNYFKIFEKFISFLDEHNEFLRKICGDCHSSLGTKLISKFSGDDECLNDVKNFMDNYSTKLQLDEYGYIDLSKMEGLTKDNLLYWFSNFVFDDGKTVGKGEVLLPILYSNVFKTPLRENKGGQIGDLFMSDDNGKTVSGRIEVKSALPGGLKFVDMIDLEKLKKLKGKEHLVNAYKNYLKTPVGMFAMDKDLFIELCVYCIAKYMHGQYPKEENFYLLIFDNQPYINSRGNIHDTETKTIKRVIDYEGRLRKAREASNGQYSFDGLDFMSPLEVLLSNAPTESENGSEEIKVKDVNGFLYIKRCKTIEETMERIMSFVDKESSVYKENKSNKRNNFTFYVNKNRKICIAHRDNPSLIVRKQKRGT